MGKTFNSKFLTILFLFLTLPCLAQNVLVKFYRDLPPTLWENTNGCPQLTIAEFQHTALGTVPLGWSTNWTVARFNEHQTTNAPLYNAWYAQVKANEQGAFLTNIVILRNQFASNQVFLGYVATNRNQIVFTNNNLNISNQVVTLSRILNQLRPLLSDMYKGEQ